MGGAKGAGPYLWVARRVKRSRASKDHEGAEKQEERHLLNGLFMTPA